MNNLSELKSETARIAREADMDLVGFAGIDRFESVHYRMRPQAHLPDAMTVVSMAMRYPKAMYELAGNTDAESYMSLDSYENIHMREMLMVAAMDVTRFIEKAGYLAIPMQTSHYRVQPYKDIEESWTQDFDCNVAAVAAGLGELGLNGVPITHEYGTRQMFISVVTDAPFEPDPMYEGPALCDKCMKCVSACRMKALDGADLKDVVIGERTFQVAQKDIWRCMWSKRFMLDAGAGPELSGMSMTINPPEGQITEADVIAAQTEKGETGGMQTWYMYADRACERVCIPPHKRNEEPLLAKQLRLAAKARETVS